MTEDRLQRLRATKSQQMVSIALKMEILYTHMYTWNVFIFICKYLYRFCFLI